MVRALALASLVALGCQGEDVERFVSEEDGASFRELDGWERHRQRGSLVLSGPGHSTIVVRGVPLNAPGKPKRSFHSVLSATGKVLTALPEARVRGPVPSLHDRFRAAEFGASFRPSGKRGRYERRHLVLGGRDRAFHLMHTAPEGRLEETGADFTTIIATLREEG